jgi:hypothetical protein
MREDMHSNCFSRCSRGVSLTSRARTRFRRIALTMPLEDSPGPHANILNSRLRRCVVRRAALSEEKKKNRQPPHTHTHTPHKLRAKCGRMIPGPKKTQTNNQGSCHIPSEPVASRER